MLNPLAIPSELLEQLRSLTESVARLPAIERMLDARLGALESRIDRLPDEIEGALRQHFERQQDGVETMQGQLEANRSAAESLPDRLDALRGDLRILVAEIGAVRDTVEPLRGPAERLARVDERLPGG